MREKNQRRKRRRKILKGKETNNGLENNKKREMQTEQERYLKDKDLHKGKVTKMERIEYQIKPERGGEREMLNYLFRRTVQIETRVKSHLKKRKSKDNHKDPL